MEELVFDAADTAQLTWLAALCPRTEGAVVFQARSLRQKLTLELLIYGDDCPDEADGGGGGSTASRPAGGGEAQQLFPADVVQHYTLVPNPNDGNIRLLQENTDRELVTIKVYNAIGALTYSSATSFEDKSASLKLNSLAPGTYYMVLRDARGDTFTLPFIKK